MKLLLLTSLAVEEPAVNGALRGLQLGIYPQPPRTPCIMSGSVVTIK